MNSPIPMACRTTQPTGPWGLCLFPAPYYAAPPSRNLDLVTALSSDPVFVVSGVAAPARLDAGLAGDVPRDEDSGSSRTLMGVSDSSRISRSHNSLKAGLHRDDIARISLKRPVGFM